MIERMTERPRTELVELARDLNRTARSVIEEDGEHAAMFFLRFDDGDVEAHLFDDAERPVGETRARVMAEAARSPGADAVAFVSEAWSARPEAIPDGGGAGDALDARDVLLLAAVDRRGNTLVLETPISRRADGTVELGDTEEYGEEYRVNVLDEVRNVWGLESPKT
jgi:hypothetical protein